MKTQMDQRCQIGRRAAAVLWGLAVAVVWVLFFNGAAFGAGPIPEEQVNRLVEAAWKEKINRLDALVYKHTITPPETEEEIRQKHEKKFSKALGH